MKYCETCAGANDDNALECKYCHTKFVSADSPDSGVVLEKGLEHSNPVTFGNSEDVNNQYVDANVENKRVTESYTNGLSTGWLVFWCIAFGIVPTFGMVMTNLVWGKEGNRNLFIMRLVTCISMFVPSVILLLLLCLLSFI